MKKKARMDAAKVIAAAIGAAAVFEGIDYFVLSQEWSAIWFVRFHVPTLAVLLGALAIAAVNFYEYHGIGPQEGIVRHGLNKQYVALTFDDGPNPEYTPKILDILKEKEVFATFFMVGRHVLKYPETARRVHFEGHDIGNHTFSHRDMVTAGKKTVLKEVYQTDAAITEVLGVRTRLFRPPRGMISNAVRRILVEHGFTIALWTVSAQDWRRDPPNTMVKRIIRHTRPGGVILFHDSGALVRSEGGSRVETVEALPLVIDALRERGYEIVPLSLMLRDLDRVYSESLIEVAPNSAGGKLD